MKITQILAVLLAMVATFCTAIAGETNVQGVKISMEKGVPHKNAMLEVEIEPGENRGILLPQVTTDPNTGNNSFKSSLNNDPTAKGMIIYVNPDESSNKNNEGVWYYDGQSFMRMSMPAGSIIMYSGSLTGKFDEHGIGINEYHGWAICNGYKGNEGSSGDEMVAYFLTNNGNMPGLPDLRGRFVVGATENVGGTPVGDTEKYALGAKKDVEGEAGENITKLKIENLPDHEHPFEIKESLITNKVRPGQPVSVELEQSINFDVFWRSFDLSGRNEDRGWNRISQTESLDYPETLKTNGNATLTVNAALELDNATHDHDYTKLDTEFNGESFDNRPEFYVVAYIIKIK